MYKYLSIIPGALGAFFSILIPFCYSDLLLGITVSLFVSLIFWSISLALFGLSCLIEKLNHIEKNTREPIKNQDFPLGFASKEDYEKQIEFEKNFQKNSTILH